MITNPKGFSLKNIISVYERQLSSEENLRDDVPETYYLESHEIVRRNNVAHIGTGTPLTAKVFDELKAHLLQYERSRTKKQTSTLLYGKSKMIYCDQRIGYQSFAWIFKAQKVNLLFDKQTRLENGFMWTPDLLFIARGRDQLTVFAIDDSNNLYGAPFFNVYSDGNVCLGTSSTRAVKAAKTFDEYTAAWESLFWDTKFNAHGVADGTKKVKEIMKSRLNLDQPFPIELLTKLSFNLDDILKSKDQ